jgi:hypothetical protein
VLWLYDEVTDHDRPGEIRSVDFLTRQFDAAADSRIRMLPLLVDPARPDTGPIWDVYATYVLTCGLRNLKEVFLGGRQVSVDGGLLHPEADRVRRETHARMARAAQDRGSPRRS